MFENISLMIGDTEKVALVGKNGAGKSTLLKLIAGLEEPTGGKVVLPQHQRVGYLPQKMILTGNQTVLKETLSAFHDIKKLEKKIEKINVELNSRTDYESVPYLNLIHELSEATEQFNLLGGATVLADAEQTLLGLGFEREDFQKHVSTFSGGWKMRIELAKILLQKPGILLLDEPTNHLDIESIIWLENFLKTYPGSVLVISHDRMFLDHVTSRTIEIYMQDFHDYPVAYSKYLILREERRNQLMATYRNQQKMIGKTEEFIERFRYKATKANQVQSRIKQLEKLERIEVEETEATIHFRFPPAPRTGDVVVEIQGLHKNYGQKKVLKDVQMTIERGEKVAFVGRNGEGKTTLAKIILGTETGEGFVKLGHNVEIGYYAQNQDELLNEKKTVFQTIDDEAKGEIRTRIRDLLGSFLFGADDIDKKVSVLSGGERSRLSLIKLLLQPVPLLILDEPTNHLDLHSKDILKKALQQYNGTLILVSHDRYFLDGLVGKVYEFRHQKVKEFLGGIFEFLEKRNLSTLQQLERRAANPKKLKTTLSTNKAEYQKRKDFERNLRKKTTALHAIESNIDSLEKKIKQLDQVMAHPEQINEVLNLEQLSQQYLDLNKELKEQINLWEHAFEDVEKWKQLKKN